MKVWDLAGGVAAEYPLELPSDALPVPGSDNPGLVLSPAGDAVAGEVDVSGGSEYRVWASTGQLRYAPRTSFLGGRIVFSPSGTSLLLGEEVVHVASAAAEDIGLPAFERRRVWSGIDDAGDHLLKLLPTQGARMLERVSRRGRVSYEMEGGLLPTQKPSGVFVSPDGSQFLVVAFDSAGVLHWDIAPQFATSKLWLVRSPELPLDASFSPDSSEFFASGDGWVRLSSQSREALEQAVVPTDVPDDSCTLTAARFANQDKLAAFGAYDPELQVRQAGTSSAIASLSTNLCNARAAFNADDTLMATTGPAVYRTSDWSRLWPTRVVAEPIAAERPLEDVQFSSDGATLLFSHCDSVRSESCQHSLFEAMTGRLIRNLNALGGARAVLSPEGHWVISDDRLLHLPTNQTLRLEQPARMSAFMPNGDIISVLEDGAIARFCREPLP